MQDGSDSTRLKASLRQLLRERRKLADGDDDNFNILDTQQLAETLSGTTQVMTTLLGAVAAVSLLVGGIGIMNIMLVSVTERTREIGLRLAIGALEREVLLQFLIEAVVLAALGGIIGIVIATGASIVLAGVMGVPYLFDPTINLLSFVFSAGIGVVFGYFPARRAAQHGPDRGAAARVTPAPRRPVEFPANGRPLDPRQGASATRRYAGPVQHHAAFGPGVTPRRNVEWPRGRSCRSPRGQSCPTSRSSRARISPTSPTCWRSATR